MSTPAHSLDPAAGTALHVLAELEDLLREMAALNGDVLVRGYVDAATAIGRIGPMLRSALDRVRAARALLEVES